VVNIIAHQAPCVCTTWIAARAAQAPYAVQYIQRAIDLRPPRKLRSRAFDLTGLGRAYLVLSEPEEACRVATEVMSIADKIGSGARLSRV
jgi:hypothetical protein